jgi:hypothetical protein
MKKQTQKQRISITEKWMDARGTCKDVIVYRVVKPYSHGDHYVSYKGQTVLVKFSGSGWYGSVVV